MTDGSSSPLSFPDGPKLELDQLIDQLVERAQGVKRAQGRLRALLRAIDIVTGDLGIEQVLAHVVEAAAELAGARYAALGMIAHDGSLEQFIHVGMDPQLVAQIGPLPQGKGLLGALITDPRPIRLEHIAEDLRSSGFPPHHPPMESFLGVPIRVRGEVFGNLYLTDSESGRFSDEDEELVRSLAVTAGTAISNARLYHESRLQQRWLAASGEISAQLLAASGEDPLQMIARRASEIADADLVTVALVTPDRESILVEAAVGVRADEIIGQRFSLADTFAGLAIEEGRPVLLRSPSDAPNRSSHLSSAIETGPVMVVPLTGSSQMLGALSITRRRGRVGFNPTDLTMAAGFADQASVAIELTAARADQQRIALLEDRDRIARDLHDHVIQQLFAIGLSLESAANLVGSNQPVAERLHARVADIDRTIRQIRTSIFELRGPLGAGGTGFRQRILDIAGDVAPALGFTPRVAFAGALDTSVADALADDIDACVREALTNVAKHARATSVDVDVAIEDAVVVVSVSDNGAGMSDTTRSSGLANLRARALAHGGSFEVTRSASGGTQLTWKAPIT